jgi:hypothetical protein
MSTFLELLYWKKKKAASGTRNKRVMKYTQILDGQPQENGHFGHLGENRGVPLTVLLGGFRCDISSAALMTESTTDGVGELGENK